MCKSKFLQGALLVCMLMTCIQLHAQTKSVTGTVTDDSTNTPLPGVTIKVKNGNQVTSSNAQGEFTISVPNDAATLEYSSVGYSKGEINVNGGSVSIRMKKSYGKLDDVIVVGYGFEMLSQGPNGLVPNATLISRSFLVLSFSTST